MPILELKLYSAKQASSIIEASHVGEFSSWMERGVSCFKKLSP